MGGCNRTRCGGGRGRFDAGAGPITLATAQGVLNVRCELWLCTVYGCCRCRWLLTGQGLVVLGSTLGTRVGSCVYVVCVCCVRVCL